MTIPLDSLTQVDFELTNDPSEAFEGRSAKITIDEDHPQFEIAAQIAIPVETPRTDNLKAIEMHYKNESILQVGIVEFTGGVPSASYIVALTPQDDWNKVYIDLTDDLIAANSVTEYHFVVASRLQPGDTNATFFLDNIKVLHLENN